MLGTRADVISDLTFAVTLLAPFVTRASFRRARRRDHEGHRRIQIALLVACILAVLALEVRIRLAGGSGALLRASHVASPGLARGALAVHITGAVVTYAAWTWLAVASHRRFRAALPGSFSRLHKRLGQLVFLGLCFTAASATVMYFVAFIA